MTPRNAFSGEFAVAAAGLFADRDDGGKIPVKLGLGYNDQKIIEAYELIEGVAADRPLHPDFRAGFETCRVIDAVLLSAAERRWVPVADI